MNERIKELGRQAGFAFIEDGVYGQRWYSSKCGMDKLEFEKFAELIVAECVRVCNKQTPNWKGEYATAFGDGVEFCIRGIKEHFGVEL
jgi:hypothetical protein